MAVDRLIAEDLLLLLLDDEKGTSSSGVDVGTLLGGALLIELAVAERVRVGERSGLWRSAKVEVLPGADPADPVLVQALATVAEKPKRAQDLVAPLGKGVRDRLTERLAADGLLERHEGKVLGLFPRTTWPARDASHEEQVRRQLTLVLAQGQTPPDLRTAALVALLHASGQAHRVVPHDGVSSRDVRRRAKEVSEQLTEGGWAAQAVSDAIAAATSAMVAVMAASTVAATAGSS